MKIVNGQQIAGEILAKLNSRIRKLDSPPRLGIIKAGQDPATELYVQHKATDAKKIGMEVEIFECENFSSDELTELIDKLNRRKNIHGFLIQLPLPLESDIKTFFRKIHTKKDVDGLNPLSLGAIWQNQKEFGFAPATVLAIRECLRHVAFFDDGEFGAEELNGSTAEKKFQRYLEGKDVVIINHSLIVGRPLAGLLLNYGCSVSICHEFTKDLKDYTKKADIIVSATGKPGLITANMIKAGVVLIDVGIKRMGDKVLGDIDLAGLEDMEGWITPVPGGVGPLTRAMLLSNTLLAFSRGDH